MTLKVNKFISELESDNSLEQRNINELSLFLSAASSASEILFHSLIFYVPLTTFCKN